MTRPTSPASPQAPAPETPAVTEERNEAEVADPTTNEKRKPKFSFNDYAHGKEKGHLKLLLLECVKQHGAHKVGHCELDKRYRYQRVLDTFLANIPESSWVSMRKPSIKTLRDKYRNMVKERKAVVEANMASSEIVDDSTEFDRLLDDLIHERSDLDLQSKRNRDEMNVREKPVVTTGEEIRKQASTRQTEDSQSSNEIQSQAPSSSRSTTPTPKRRKIEDLRMDEWQKNLTKLLEAKLEAEKRALDLREKDYELQRQKWEEEKIDREERRSANSAHLVLLNALINKLK